MSVTQDKVLLLREGDDMVVAVKPVAEGDVIAVNGTEVRAAANIPPATRSRCMPSARNSRSTSTGR